MNDDLGAALEGVRVVAAATNIPGPMAAARFAELGASVWKAEPKRGDPLETAAPQWYARLHARVEVERLDLSLPGDRDALHGQIASADVLLTAMRTRALERAGIAHEMLRERYPRLVQVAVVGESAPHQDRAGHDLTYQARAGLLSPPSMPRTLVGDLAAAEQIVSATLAALLARARDGRGRYFEIGIVDAAHDFAAPFRYGLTTPDGALGGDLATYRMYRASEGWVAVAALESHFIEGLRDILKIETLDEASIAAAIAQRPARDWERLAQARDVPLAEVNE
ncbi:MAG TPA: CoA transferase [Candidatus Baltobacteraceae bacterium]|jgi:crotonobetainyl-CoA:carnitine CoA-transferase CaiB-like acyl-CoA transferase|nr:CoA transferase [Candidatus Baltobacteraceae bacterium]